MGNYETLFKPWDPAQRQFVINELATWQFQTEIFKKISDPEALEKYGFETWAGTENAMRKRIRKLPESEIKQARLTYLSEFENIPLAWKKERVKKLIKALEKAEKSETITDNDKIFHIRTILKEIRAEMGEEALLEALKESGKAHLSLADRLVGRYLADSSEGEG
jgi:hypothetical protein